MSESRFKLCIVKMLVVLGVMSAVLLFLQVGQLLLADCQGGPVTYHNKTCYINVGIVKCPNEDDCVAGWGNPSYQCVSGGIRHNQRYCTGTTGTCIFSWYCSCGAKLNCNGVPIGGNCSETYDNC